MTSGQVASIVCRPRCAGVGVDGRRDAVGGEDGHRALGDRVVELLDEDRAALAQLLDDVLVVDDLLAHVDRRAVAARARARRSARRGRRRRSSRAARRAAASRGRRPCARVYAAHPGRPRRRQLARSSRSSATVASPTRVEAALARACRSCRRSRVGAAVVEVDEVDRRDRRARRNGVWSSRIVACTRRPGTTAPTPTLAGRRAQPRPQRRGPSCPRAAAAGRWLAMKSSRTICADLAGVAPRRRPSSRAARPCRSRVVAGRAPPRRRRARSGSRGAFGGRCVGAQRARELDDRRRARRAVVGADEARAGGTRVS